MGLFFFTKVVRLMNENETFCVEKQSRVCLLGMAVGVFKSSGPFLLKSVFL